ncbi:LysR family transcriptional regulator [Rhizobiales bacterium]|uniref:LysR substrate-binding domain-containing protein n=1 Tax=Hongsoonwoonella zoysiae TaxID=2821844 RepID=UPI0015618507|nr:LysR substrate-binding domain-containing protein [Hongsoonwoonella zoysiae]NRG16996.1 LysR family transcriptional regulator [Hongsoonwoonella zoysiae]
MTRRNLPSFKKLRAFEAAARHLSFKLAAEELAVTPSAISHQIRALESELGEALFKRHTRALSLTDAGAAYANSLKAAFDDIDAATARIRAHPRRTSLRVALLSSFATNWLVRRLGAFSALHPSIEVFLLPSVGLARLEHGNADIAIRYGKGDWAGLDARLLAAETLTPVCSPAYRSANGGMRAVEDLSNCTLLFSHSENPMEWPSWCGVAGIELAGAKCRYLHDYNIVLQAAEDGLGVAMGRRWLIGDRIRKGRLVVPFPDMTFGGKIGHWIVTSGKPTPEAAMFADWISKEAANVTSELDLSVP